MACPLFLCPVYARQSRVYNIDRTKKAAEARPFRGTLIYGDCTAWISVPFFRAHFNVFSNPLHGPFYTFAAWSTFVKCMEPFTGQCMKAFTVVSTDFSRCMRSFTIARAGLHHKVESNARGRLRLFRKTNARGRLRLFRGSGGRSQ